MFDLEEALAYVVKRDGSDLHLKVPSRPLARIHGQLIPLEYYEPMKPEEEVARWRSIADQMGPVGQQLKAMVYDGKVKP